MKGGVTMEFYFSYNVVDDMFIGYTENKYLIIKYLDQFKPFIPDITVYCIDAKSEKEFLEMLNIGYQKINNTNSIFRMDQSNELYSIKDDNSDEIIVINKVIYQNFVNSFCSSNETNKIQHMWYRHIGPHGLLLNNYINDEDIKNSINKMSHTIFNSNYRYMKDYIQQNNYYDIYSDLQHGCDAYIWNYYNEYYELWKYLKVFFELYSKTIFFQ